MQYAFVVTKVSETEFLLAYDEAGRKQNHVFHNVGDLLYFIALHL